MKYYVYGHYKADTDELFYIGKGVGKRAHSSYHRSKLWENTVKKHGHVVRILEYFFDKDAALQREVELISKYGRRDLGTGPLVNLTNGGDGASGAKLSEATKFKMSMSKLGRKNSSEHNANIAKARQGIQFSPEHKAKLSIAAKARRATLEARSNMSIAMKGKIFSEEHRAKLSSAAKLDWQKRKENNGN